MKAISLGYDGMTLEDLVAIARHGAKVQLSEESEKRIVKGRKLIDQWVKAESQVFPKLGYLNRSAIR